MQILRLANEDQSVIVDLMRGPLRLRAGFNTTTPGMAGAYTYEPYGAQFAFGNFQPVSESFELACKGSGTLVRAAMDNLQDFLESVRLFHAGDLAAQSCWLEWSSEGESPKRTLLYSGTFKVTSEDNITPGMAECTVIGQLNLTRHPLWENVAYSTINTGALSDYGGKYDYTGVTGNTLARMWASIIVGSVGGDFNRLWFGIRRFNQGVANFEPVWECEDGTNTAGVDTADVGDATASAANKVQVTFATVPGMGVAPRFTITVAQVCAIHGHASYTHFHGRYLVLCRCKVSAGTAGLQLRSGYTGNVLSEEVYIDNTNWRLIPLGNISIPPWEGMDYATDMSMASYRLDLWAEELVACDLDLDCFVLIPNEHLLTLEGGDIGLMTYAGLVWTNEDDTEVAFEYTGAPDRIHDTLDAGMTDWYLPPTSGCIVVAGEEATLHDMSETITTQINYFPRWLLYRQV